MQHGVQYLVKVSGGSVDVQYCKSVLKVLAPVKYHVLRHQCKHKPKGTARAEGGPASHFGTAGSHSSAQIMRWGGGG